MSAANFTSAFFEAKYRNDPDPWDFAHNPYEQLRYRGTLAALAPCRFHRALEPGCSVGILTEQLAAICGAVEAFDFSPSAAETARLRCAHLPSVHITCAALSAHTPTADVDLLVLSEIGYYYTLDEWFHVASTLISHLPSGATVIAVHWLGYSPDHRLSGDQVHSVLFSLPSLELQLDRRFEDNAAPSQSFRLSKWVRR